MSGLRLWGRPGGMGCEATMVKMCPEKETYDRKEVIDVPHGSMEHAAARMCYPDDVLEAIQGMKYKMCP